METTIRKHKVIWTYVIALFTIAAFIGMRFQASGEIIPDSLLVKYGAPYAMDIYDGSFWGVITNSFLHNSFSAFLPNILFFLIVGWLIEKINGSWFLLFFGLSASIVSSCVELAFSADPGIGMTGVNFALLGYILVSKDIKWRNPWLRATPWFVVGFALFLCAEQIVKNDYTIAVFSLLSGLAFGLIVGITKSHRKFFYMVQFIIIGISALSLLYNPYSSEWNNVKGYQNQIKGNRAKARFYYQKALKIAPENAAARRNLKNLKLARLIDEAYEAHLNKQYGKARQLYIQILNMDKNNKWAADNLAELPQ